MNRLQIPYETLLETIQEGIWVIDADSNTTYANPKMAEILGYEIEEMIGKNLFEFMDEEEIQNAERKVESRKSGLAETHESRLKHKNGHDVYVELKTVPITDDEGNYNGAIAGFADITDRKKAEEALKESEEKLSSILNNITDVVWSISWPDLKPLYISPSLEKLYGRPAQEFYANPALFKEVTHPEDRHLTEKAMEQLQAKGEAVRECRIVKPDGSVIWVTDRSKMIYDENQQPVRVDGVTQDITNRKQAEDDLRENEEMLSTIIETVGEGIALKDASDRFVHWNKTASDIFGLDVEHARGQTPAVFDIKFIYEDGTEYAGDDYPSQYTLRTGESCNNAIMGIKRSNHSITWLKINTRPIFKSGDTKPSLVVISFSDITEQKEKEKQLRDSEVLLARSQQIAHIGSWNLDLRTNYLTWTDEVYRIFGIRPQEFTATYEAFLDAVHPDDRMAVDEAYNSSVREEHDEYAMEHRIVRRDTGEIRIVHERCVHERDEAGDIIRSIGMVQDITEHKKAEQALQARERFLAKTLQTTIDGFWVVDSQKRIIQVNDAYCVMSGYSREELLRMTINDLEANEAPEDTSARIKQIIESGSDLFETYHQRKDGTIFPLEISTTYLAENGGQLICFCRDITERKKTEEALKLQAAERAAVDTFTYSVSNDLQAPLRRIEGFSEALQEECADQLNDRAKDYLKRIVTQVGSMKNLTDALLQLSKVVSRDIDRETLDLSALVRSNLETLKFKEPERQLELVVAPGVCAEGDPELLNLMLGCLLENAWKFTSGVEIARIEFGSNVNDGRAVYYLKDNGVGFDMNHAEKLFAPFQKLHSDNDYTGIGIGLNLAYRIISRHGGEIWAEGEEGKGACFFFTLP